VTVCEMGRLYLRVISRNADQRTWRRRASISDRPAEPDTGQLCVSRPLTV